MSKTVLVITLPSFSSGTYLHNWLPHHKFVFESNEIEKI